MSGQVLWPGSAIERPAPVAVYLGFAHAALFGLGGALALWPEALAAGHAPFPAVAMTHALTLGWITASILGSLHLVLPLALAARLPVSAADTVVACVFALGAVGLVLATALGRLDQVALPGVACAVAMLWVGTRAVAALLRSRAPRAITAHVALAFLAILAAAALAIAWTRGWLVLARADLVDAHAHLAAVGFAVTMAVGIGHRLLPMFLPAAPRGAAIQGATLLVPVGAIGLAACIVLGLPRAPAVGVIALGLGAFFAGVLGLLRARRPPPRDLPQPDIGKVQVFAALASLLAAAVVGAILAGREAPSPRLAAAYATLGLLGFLGQLIAGIGLRLFPTYLWAHAWRRRARASSSPPLPPVRMPVRALSWIGSIGLATATVSLAASAGSEATPWIRAAGVALTVAGTALAANLVACIRRAGGP